MKNEQVSLFALRILSESEYSISTAYVERLSNRLSDWNSYQQIDLFLTILEKKNIDSQKVFTNLVPLLRQRNFLIARRVFWFLFKKNLSKDNERELMVFYNTNASKL